MSKEMVQISFGEKEREKLRKKCDNDLYFFLYFALGYKDLDKELHGELCRQLEGLVSGNYLFLLPRGHLKTTCITKGFAVWRAVKNPNIRINLSSESHALSKGFLTEIKGHFERNDMFRWLYSDVIPENFDKAEKWNASEITLNRTGNYTEATIETSGLDSGIVSRHYDIMIKDDLVSLANIGTEEQRQKVIDWHKQAKPLLLTDGLDITIGTTWHYYDLYNYIQTNEKDTKVYIRKAIENGRPIYPKKFNLRELEKRKDVTKGGMGSYMFSMQYMLTPIDDENAVFRKSWFKYYNELPDRMYVVMTVDPANEPENDSTNDYTAIVVTGVDDKKNMYILKYLRGRWSPKETVKHMYDLKEFYRPKKVGIEQVNFAKMLKYFVKDEGLNRNDPIKPVELKHGGVNKHLRIRALQPYYEYGMVYHSSDMHDLEDELITFPKGKNDDLIDALAYVLEIMKMGGVEPEQHKFVIDNFIRYSDYEKIQNDPEKRKPASIGVETLNIQEYFEYIRRN